MSIEPNNYQSFFRPKLIIVMVLPLMSIACATEVKTSVWESAQLKGYPELYDERFERYIHKNTRSEVNPQFGIAFSGGGTRAAPATLGQLRALYKLGIYQKADYISVVSGGGWAAVPFVYRPKNVGVGDFFDEYVEPKDIKAGFLQCNKKDTLADAISNAKFSFFKNNIYYSGLVGRGDEVYARYLGNIFLKPFNLKKGFKSKFFTWTEDYWEKNIHDNNKGLTKDDFNFVHDKSPYLIANTTLMPFRSSDQRDFLPVEITPAYVGSPINATLKFRELSNEKYEESEKKSPIQIGGYVEPMAYDTRPPEIAITDTKRKYTVSVDGWDKRFSLSDAIASIGAAPQQTLHKAGIFRPITTNIGMPEFRHWGSETKKPTDYYEYAHADGGHLDNFGLLPLLARKVEKILVFVNTPTEYRYKNGELKIDSALVSVFNLKDKKKYNKVFRNHPHNIVFDGRQFQSIVKAFDKQTNHKQGEIENLVPEAPLVHCDTYDVMDNKRFNVTSHYNDKNKTVYKPKICWVYLSNSKAWYDAILGNKNIDPEMKHAITNKKSEFRRFPHYWTFVNDLPKLTLIDKTHAQVNLLANLTHWTVEKIKDYISKELGLDNIVTKHTKNEEMPLHGCIKNSDICRCDKSYDDKKLSSYKSRNEVIIEGE